jgi:NADH-quinone oxidoreductase subunit J
MTLFLFVVMMLNIDLVPLREGFVRYLPFGILVLLFLLGIMFLVLWGQKSMSIAALPVPRSADYSNIAVVGGILFTKYLFAFEIAGLILLVAMVAAISLAFHGRKPGTKAQKVKEQLTASKSTGLRVVKMKTEI